MNILSFLYNEAIYKPLFNLMVFFYNAVPGHDIGIAIILLTLFVRLLFYPINGKAIESQKKMQEIQPKIKEIQKKYKDNKEEQAKKLMEFYQKNKINPLSGCLPLLIQFPILIALYHVFINGFKDESLSAVYTSYISNPGHIDPLFLGLINLSETNIYLALIAGSLQYFQTRMMMGDKKEEKEEKKEEKSLKKTPEEKTQEFAQNMTKQMIYLMPVMTFVFAMSFPSGLALYWAVTTLLAIVQQYIMFKKQKNIEVETVN